MVHVLTAREAYDSYILELAQSDLSQSTREHFIDLLKKELEERKEEERKRPEVTLTIGSGIEDQWNATLHEDITHDFENAEKEELPEDNFMVESAQKVVEEESKRLETEENDDTSTEQEELFSQEDDKDDHDKYVDKTQEELKERKAKEKDEYYIKDLVQTYNDFLEMPPKYQWNVKKMQEYLQVDFATVILTKEEVKGFVDPMIKDKKKFWSMLNDKNDDHNSPS